MTKAVCSIEAVSRWAVTATPLQNRLTDLATLLQFIRAHPYDDPRHFERDISQLWKEGDSGEAVRRLKQLSACLILRRNKGTIDLPPRKDLLYPLEFSTGEREEYQRLRQRTINRIDDLLHDRQQQSTPGGVTYVNALQQIETLRLFCDLGMHYSNRTASAPVQHDDSHDWQDHAQAAFNRQCEMATVVCLQCSSATGLTDALLASESRRAPQATFFSCLRFVCSDCVEELGRSQQTLPCGHPISCPAAPVTTSSTMGDVDAFDDEAVRNGSGQNPGYVPQISSKVRALVADLQTLPPGVKW